MATATILCTQTSFGIGGYGSADETTVLVGKADGYTENARVRFAPINPAWVIKSIKFQFRRNDGDATRVLRFGTNQSASFDSRNTLDWKKNFSVSSGYVFKTFDFTPYKAIIQAYPGNWYVHITHGSGDRSYCTFNGGGSSNRPRIVVEYEDSSLVVPDDTFTLGEPTTFTVGFDGSGMTHKLYYAIGSASGQITDGETDEFAGGAEITWAPPIELANEMPDTDVGTISITVETYEGGVLRSTVPFEFNLAAPDDMVPVIENVTLSLVNPSNDTVGEYVQGRSRARAVIAASSVYGAEIASYQMVIDGTAYGASEPEVLSAVLNVPGTKTVTITVTDTRGRTMTQTLPSALTVYPYTPPVVASLKLERALNEPPDYPASNSGQYIKFTLDCVFSPINGKNSKSGSVRFKPAGGEWSEPFSLDDAMASMSGVYSFVLYGLLGNDDIGSGTYEVEVTLADRYNTVTQGGELSSRNILWDARASGGGMAFGGEAVTSGVYDFYKPMRIRDTMQFDNPAAVLANLAPFCILTQPVSETFSYHSTSRWWTFNWQEIDTNPAAKQKTTSAVTAATGAGTATLLVKGAVFGEDGIEVDVVLAAADVATTTTAATAIKNALNANAAFAAHFVATSSSAHVIMEAIVAAPQDATVDLTVSDAGDTGLTIGAIRNGGFQFKQGGSDGTRNIGVIVPEDGVYYAALSVRFSTAGTQSDFWMRIAVFPEDTVFPARSYFLDSDGVSGGRERITQVILAWSSSHTIGNAAGAFRCYAGEIILPYGYLNSASKQLSSETRFWVWKIG